MPNSIPVLQSEYSLLNKKFGRLNDEKNEIAQLGKDANLQGSETFGHDNPVLESKHEKALLLSIQTPKFQEIKKQLLSCLIVTEDEIKKRKQDDLLSIGKISIGLGSIVTLKIEGAPKERSFLICGLTQGAKITFMGEEHPTICTSSPIRQGISGKFAGDIGGFSHNGNLKKVHIINVR